MKNKTCFETIKVEDGTAKNLEYHQKRVDRTRRELFHLSDKLDLKEHLNNLPHAGVHRVRIEYEKDVKSLTCRQYEVNREFNSFKIVHSKLSYQYKFSNREELDSLVHKSNECDDIIIVKNGLLSDTSIANIALEVNGVWLTPQLPLLRGATRERLLDEGLLTCAHLTVKDLEKMEKFAIINSLLEFKIIKNVRIII
jgi:4-amino-4-deoxychorismate lyase